MTGPPVTCGGMGELGQQRPGGCRRRPGRGTCPRSCLSGALLSQASCCTPPRPPQGLPLHSLPLPTPRCHECRACHVLGRGFPQQQAPRHPGCHHLPLAAPNPQRCLSSGWDTRDGGRRVEPWWTEALKFPIRDSHRCREGPVGAWQGERVGEPQISAPAQSLLDSWNSTVGGGRP